MSQLIGVACKEDINSKSIWSYDMYPNFLVWFCKYFHLSWNHWVFFIQFILNM